MGKSVARLAARLGAIVARSVCENKLWIFQTDVRQSIIQLAVQY
jgi:hypothetical protein